MQKTILITGSTDGIGKLLAIKLAKEGHKVCIHGRTPAKVQSLLTKLQQTTNNKSLKAFTADFSDLAQVKAMAIQAKAQLSHIDVLINNAGVFHSPNLLNKDGLDMRIVVNYLAPYLLTNELLPLLHNATEARIINLSSAAQASVSHQVLTGQSQAIYNHTYAQSKLALTMWSFQLSRQLPDIAVVAVNPGSLLNTKMVQEAYGTSWAPADKGADILHKLALSYPPNAIDGKYFDNDRGTFNSAHPDAYNQSKINALLQTTTQILQPHS